MATTSSPSPTSSSRPMAAPRWFAGININSDCRRIESSLIGVHGHGSGAPVEIRKTMSFDLPHEITECYHELQSAVSEQYRERYLVGQPPVIDGQVSTSLYLHLLRELAGVEEEALDELIGEARLTRNDISAVGIHDSGLRRNTPNGLFYQSLCDAPYLAEQTGLNIIDSFPLQDIASRGNGGPVLAMPTWIFLKSEQRDRIFLDLGRTAKMMFLPKANDPFSHQRIECRDIIPCGSLIDALTWELTHGETSIDVGGRLTVQGCQIPGLLTELRFLVTAKHSWNPFGLSPGLFLKTAARLTGAGHSYQDILCTATCFIAEVLAETVASTIAHHKAETSGEPEILLGGSGRLHGMLLNLISTSLQQRPMKPIVQLGIPGETFDSLCAAMLAVMAVDHIPASLPHLTGSTTTKPLGRVTPGSITNWHRLLQEMAQTKPVVRPLRSAM